MANTDDHDQFIRALGARLAEIRRERSLTQAEVAEAADVDAQTIQRAENGRTTLSLHRLRIIAGVLGVDLAGLFASVGTEVPEPTRDPDEIAVVQLWHRVPRDRRALARRVLREFGQQDR